MRTNVIEKTENTQCQKFACVRGHAVAVCSRAVVDRSDFLNSEWQIVYSSRPQVIDAVELLQPVPHDAIVCTCREQEFETCTDLEISAAVTKVLVDEMKKNIRNLSVFTVEPLTFMLPYETIQHFRRLIAGYKTTIRYLENR